MKIFIKANIFLGICMLLMACGQSITPTASPVPSLTVTAAATITPLPANTSTPAITSTARPEHVPPTLIPTSDPTLLPELLNNAFAVQMMEGINGHTMKQITGWDYGFGGGYWNGSCGGYYLLDRTHLLIYPAAGQVSRPEGMWGGINIVPQPVVINLESGNVWLPPVNASSPRDCQQVYWSRELGILITSETHENSSNVSTYTYDGRKLASFPGSILDISPSRTKLLIAEDTLLDLRTNKTIKLNWSMEDYHEGMISELFWTYPDETRVYRCCYFYADLNTGTSYRFEKADFQDKNGNPLNYEGLWLYRGGWVRNDTYFLVTWSYVDDGDIRYIPMFDPATKRFYDVRQMAGISSDLTCWETTTSNNGLFVWMQCYDKTYLVNLATFETDIYTGLFNSEIDWSADDTFALLESYDSSNTDQQYYLLSLSNKELQTVAINDLSDFWYGWWHPRDPVFAYMSEDSQKLVLFDAEDITFQELNSPVTFDNFAWSPDGDRIALAAEDGSVWQVDYPKLENLEQLTPPLPAVHGIDWSYDGNFISFTSESDIYIVDVPK